MLEENIRRCKQILDLQNDRLYMLLDAIEEHAKEEDFISVKRLIENIELKLNETKNIINEISDNFYSEKHKLNNNRFEKSHYCTANNENE